MGFAIAGHAFDVGRGLRCAECRRWIMLCKHDSKEEQVRELRMEGWACPKCRSSESYVHIDSAGSLQTALHSNHGASCQTCGKSVDINFYLETARRRYAESRVPFMKSKAAWILAAYSGLTCLSAGVAGALARFGFWPGAGIGAAIGALVGVLAGYRAYARSH